MLKRKARRIGSSIVVTIPSQLVTAYNIKNGDNLKIEITQAGLLIKAIPT